MACLILVHGAYHGGWCWEQLVPLLEECGHRILAPDLPGMGDNAASGLVATLDEWAVFLARLVSGQPSPAILVGHSRAGLVISRTAELIPDRLAGLVYLSAILAPPGVAAGKVMGFDDLSPEIAAAVTPSADGRTSRWSSAESARRTFYNETNVSVAERAFARLCPEPSSNPDLPVGISSARYGKVPRAYIECLRDAAIPIVLQRRMVAAQPCKVFTLDTDHSPFFSRTGELAALLDAIARDWMPRGCTGARTF
jgi:pimeloyl-ACP methyl ester carboxylesterase